MLLLTNHKYNERKREKGIRKKAKKFINIHEYIYILI